MGMDGIVDPDERLDGTAIGSGLRTATTDDWREGGEGRSPSLTLDGFGGPLDHLLTLARTQKIDLSDIPLASLVDQLMVALQQAPAKIPLGQKGDWVVMAAWLIQLRSRLLLPAPAQQKAATEADQLRTRLVALEDVQALARWLERRPQLGHDVFARGRPPSHLSLACSVAQSPEVFGISGEAGPTGDVIEFLWASLALFDDAVAPETTPLYRPRPFDLYAVAEARDRIRRYLAETPEGVSLTRLLPDLPDSAESVIHKALRRRSAWSSTLIASLELAKQGDVVLAQEHSWTDIQVRAGAHQACPGFMEQANPVSSGF